MTAKPPASSVKAPRALAGSISGAAVGVGADVFGTSCEYVDSGRIPNAFAALAIPKDRINIPRNFDIVFLRATASRSNAVNAKGISCAVQSS
jgi:hypothetical protein